MLQKGHLATTDLRISAALQVIQSLTFNPCARTTAVRIQRLRDVAGRSAVLDVVLICSGFNIIVRVADAFHFELPSSDQLQTGTRLLARFGYLPASGAFPRLWGPGHRGEAIIEAAVRKLLAAIFSNRASLPLSVRRRTFASRPISGPLGDYVEKIRLNGAEISDSDMDRLREFGYAEDELFEATVCAACGTGLDRLRFGLNAAGILWPRLDAQFATQMDAE